MVELVPFDLQGNHTGNQVINIANTGNVGRQDPFVGLIEKFATTGARPDWSPSLWCITLTLKDIIHLAEDDEARIKDALGQTQCRVDQRRCVDPGTLGLLMQARIHRGVGLFQAANADRFTAAQQGVVGANIEFNLFVVYNWHCPNHTPSFPSICSRDCSRDGSHDGR